jgi:hypothetical protein
MNIALLKKAVDGAGRFRADFVKAECNSEEDLLMLAVAMMQQAELIFNELGGSELAAKQFYSAADRMASDATSQT